MSSINKKPPGTIFNMVLIMLIVFNMAKYTCAKPNLDTETQVIEYVNKITDFNSIGGINYSVKRIDVNEDETPFLQEKIKGKKNVWLVEAKHVRLRLKSAIQGYRDRYDRKFDILLNPGTGNLLKITSKYDGYDPDMRPEPNAVSAERQLRASGEIYLGFPDVQPSISFLDALNIILKDGVGSPFSAKEIDAFYVMYSRYNSEPCRAWVITLRGIPPLPVSIPPGASKEIAERVWDINHIRTVINDETGKILSMGNTPQPDNIQK